MAIKNTIAPQVESKSETVEARLGMKVWTSCEGSWCRIIGIIPDSDDGPGSAVYKLLGYNDTGRFGCVWWDQIQLGKDDTTPVRPPSDMRRAIADRGIFDLAGESPEIAACPGEADYDDALRTLLELTKVLHRLPIMHQDFRVWEAYDRSLTKAAEIHDAINGLRGEYVRDVALGMSERWVPHDVFNRERIQKRDREELLKLMASLDGHIDTMRDGMEEKRSDELLDLWCSVRTELETF